MKLWALYTAAAFCEIAGCFAFWAWLRNGKPASLAIPGVVALIAFAWLLTRVDVAYAGRAYAAYGGLYIVASLVWLGVLFQKPFQFLFLRIPKCRRLNNRK